LKSILATIIIKNKAALRVISKGFNMGGRFERREFLKLISSGLFAAGVWGMGASAKSAKAMEKSLLEAIETSDVEGALKLLARSIRGGADPWKIHLSLYPVVQRVLNPPFINPHLPKMFNICRELVSYLSGGKIAALVTLEVAEYARRPKMKKIRRATPLTHLIAFKEIEVAIKENNPEKVTALMAAFLAQKGGLEFARRVLLLGSGYLNHSLGHSLSCTAFILLEMLERGGEDSWPALSALADYFCKGRFHITPGLKKSASGTEKKDLNRFMVRAASGRGIVNLHHPITLYAIERTRKFLNQEEYDHMVNTWVEFMGDKREEEVSLAGIKLEPIEDDGRFYEMFSRMEARRLTASLRGMISSEEGRQKLGRFIVQAVCDKYQGDYNPHYLTGLGSVLWVVDQYRDQPRIVTNALFQYLDFFFSGLRS
jgi:hypothetical protein